MRATGSTMRDSAEGTARRGSAAEQVDGEEDDRGGTTVGERTAAALQSTRLRTPRMRRSAAVLACSVLTREPPYAIAAWDGRETLVAAIATGATAGAIPLVPHECVVWSRHG